jgi:hypothetical protein
MVPWFFSKRDSTPIVYGKLNSIKGLSRRVYARFKSLDLGIWIFRVQRSTIRVTAPFRR